jgi:hypothetical protein
MIIRDKWTPAELEIKDEISDFRHAFRNGGVNLQGAKLTIEDAISTPSAPLMFKRVISEVVQGWRYRARYGRRPRISRIWCSSW